MVQPTDVLAELRDRLHQASIRAAHLKKNENSNRTTQRRVKRGSNMAQSFSLGTVSRAKFHRRSVRFAEVQKNGEYLDSASDDDDLKENSYSEHIKGNC